RVAPNGSDEGCCTPCPRTIEFRVARARRHRSRASTESFVAVVAHLSARFPVTDINSLFSPRSSEHEIEEGQAFAPKFDARGLIAWRGTVVRPGSLLMGAYRIAQALERTLDWGEAWFYSRSRQALWKKGETSGHVMQVAKMRVDCDQDVLWLRVRQVGAGACH